MEHTEPSSRPAPIVIQAPPPLHVKPCLHVALVVAGTALAVLGAVLLIAVSFPLRQIGAYAGVLGLSLGLLLSGGAVITVLVRKQDRRNRDLVGEWRKRYEAQFPDWRSDRVRAALARDWYGHMSVLDARAVARELCLGETDCAAAACVVCLGPVEVPRIGDLRFEPVIISPTRFVWRRLAYTPVAAVVLVLWLTQKLHWAWLPFLVAPDAFGYVFVMAVIGIVAWVWRTTVRPAYVRLAPGMVQVLEYRPRSVKPAIRSYPMAPGTLAVIRQDIKHKCPSSVQLLTGEQVDVLPVSQMRNSEEVMQRIWQALLSTAPTPPLSEEELVG